MASYHIPPVLLAPIVLKVAGWRAHYEPGKFRPIEAIQRSRR
jgi:hypothetical protein